ncbi:hypothetical protein JOF29_007999 [Kribbella aluminosa]|uniref:Uncharacterized protein n=1 Tax=Kribbella aluminosa TaxID=416017 RepID=A0ABS4UZC4_9ACTN|nr:hypothetical protein [Kribbella aluminosa]
MDRLHQEWKTDKNSPGGRAFVAAVGALRALREEREGEYQGKQLGYGPQSYDVRDCAELKVPVDREFTPGGYERGPSHRLVYREFDPLPTMEDGRVVPDPNAQAYRQPITFAHRSHDPADSAGQRRTSQDSAWDVPSACRRVTCKGWPAEVDPTSVPSARASRPRRSDCRCLAICSSRRRSFGTVRRLERRRSLPRRRRRTSTGRLAQVPPGSPAETTAPGRADRAESRSVRCLLQRLLRCLLQRLLQSGSVGLVRGERHLRLVAVERDAE